MAHPPAARRQQLAQEFELFCDTRSVVLGEEIHLLALGLIEYLEANYGQSAVALSRMTANYIQKASSLAAACAQLGREDAARTAALEFRHLSKKIPVCPTRSKAIDWPSFWRLAYPYLQEDAFEQILDGIGKADLPV